MKGKELMIVELMEIKPQYGGRTLVEKVTAYKLSDGELVGDKESALKWQKKLDKEERVEFFVKKYLKPFQASLIEKDGTVQIDVGEVVSLYSVKNLLRSYEHWKRELG